MTQFAKPTKTSTSSPHTQRTQVSTEALQTVHKYTYTDIKPHHDLEACKCRSNRSNKDTLHASATALTYATKPKASMHVSSLAQCGTLWKILRAEERVSNGLQSTHVCISVFESESRVQCNVQSSTLVNIVNERRQALRSVYNLCNCMITVSQICVTVTGYLF